MVGDGDAVRIAGEIVQNMLGTSEWGLGIDDPSPRERAVEEIFESNVVR
jgi:hypothetical protein